METETMDHEAFVQALDTVAGELLRRAEDYAGDDTMEPCHLILTNAAMGVLIALNTIGGRKASPLVIEGDAVSFEAPTAPGILCRIPVSAILTQGAL